MAPRLASKARAAIHWPQRREACQSDWGFGGVNAQIGGAGATFGENLGVEGAPMRATLASPGRLRQKGRE